MLNILFFLFSIFLLPTASCAQGVPQYAENALISLKDGTSDYQQTKVLSQGLRLISSGRISISQKSGLAWIQLKPFLQTTLINDDSIYLRTQTDRPQIISASKNPEIYNIIATLKSLFEGDRLKLEKDFKVMFNGDRTDWTMILSPKNEPLSRIISTVEVKGGARLNSVYIKECAGATTHIQFGPIRPLSEEDKKNYEFAK